MTSAQARRARADKKWIGNCLPSGKFLTNSNAYLAYIGTDDLSHQQEIAVHRQALTH